MNYPLFKIIRKISINGMRIEECMAQYSHPQPYSGLALRQLGLGGQSQAPVTQGDPFRAPKQPEIRPKQLTASLCTQVSNMWLVWGTNGPVSQPTTLLWSCPTSAGSRGQSHAAATKGDPIKTLNNLRYAQNNGLVCCHAKRQLCG